MLVRRQAKGDFYTLLVRMELTPSTMEKIWRFHQKLEIDPSHPQSILLGIFSKATKLSYGANFVICVCMCVCNYNFIYA